jgi:hypothetical protein
VLTENIIINAVTKTSIKTQLYETYYQWGEGINAGLQGDSTEVHLEWGSTYVQLVFY